ncbi:sulfatase-like hydrolase/transferase [Paenibacillus sp. HB172176]|uniref:sulfatase-like hydrolase/transferase n=1 Tax=Paenibacillus sp. HB172176 TaxID=2493690 RepID=UPI00143B3D5E|nr:sulfatase-like hydrolase/transferase [Paenibacillus sp. HB172176]
MTKKKNILFFFTDDQRFDTIAALGNSAIHTPNMDELVRRGVSFTQAHIPGGTVGAVCMPSRAMLHTGRTLFHLERDGSVIPEEHALMGETFREAGYRTFGTGKWHNGPEAFNRSFEEGDEIFFGGMADHWNVPANHYDPSGAYPNRRRIIDNPFYERHISRENICDHIHPGKHSSELFSDCAISWLEQADPADARPFFLYLAFMAPHDPRSMPERFKAMYDPDQIELPDNFLAEHPFDFGVSGIRDEVLAAQPRKQEEMKEHLAEYYGMISHLDHELGKVVDCLKRRGVYEDTIIVFAGDNGLALGQHGLMGKQSSYEHSVRVPLLFSGLGLPANERRNQYVYLLDIFPTLCELSEIDIPSSVEGISLLQAMSDPDAPTRDELYLAYGDCVRAVKNDRYKLIEYSTASMQATQLFDLNGDPSEKANLADNEEHKPLLHHLRTRLQFHREASGDDRHPVGQAFWDNYSKR